MSNDNESIKALRARIRDNPFDYDAYRALIAVLSSPSERHAVYKEFSARFPLDEATWMKWLDDLDALSEVSTEEKTGIYKASLEDYLSPRLFARYCEYVSRQNDDNATRTAYKEAVARCGAHYSLGHVVLDSWCQFEEAKNNKETIEYALRRRATLPLKDVESYSVDYINRFTEESKAHLDAIKKANETVQQRKGFEQSLVEARGSTAEIPGSPETASNAALEKLWLNNLIGERKANPKKKLTLLFERATADCCLSPALWSLYVNDVIQTDDLQTGRAICKKALRNIPNGSPSIFAALVLSSASLEEAQAVFQDARNNAPRLIDLCEPLESLAAFAFGQDSSTKESMLAVSDLAMEILAKLAKRHDQAKETLIRVLRFAWTKTREERVLKELCQLNKTYWIKYVESKLKGATDEAGVRKLFAQAMHECLGHASVFEDLAHRQLEFELRNGVAAYVKAKAIIDAKRQANFSTHPNEKSVRINAQSKAPSARLPEESEDIAQGTHRDKRQKLVPKEKDEQSLASTSGGGIRPTKIRENADKHIVFIPSLPDSATIESVRDFFTRLVKVQGAFVDKVEIKTRAKLVNPRTGEALTRQYAFVEFGGENRHAGAEKACKLSGSDFDDGHPLTILIAEPPPSQRAHPQHQDDKMELESSAPMPRAPSGKKTLFKPRAVVVHKAA